jgi:hypothetical protein
MKERKASPKVIAVKIDTCILSVDFHSKISNKEKSITLIGINFEERFIINCK